MTKNNLAKLSAISSRLLAVNYVDMHANPLYLALNFKDSLHVLPRV